jgi:pilus assembly protein CpaF
LIMSLLKRIEKGQQDGQVPSRLQELRARRAPTVTGRDAFLDLKERIQDKLIAELDPRMDVTKTDEVRETIEGMYDQILAQEGHILSRQERQRLFEQIVAEILGYGPLDPLLRDEEITEIMVNGPDNIFIERRGKLERVTVSFESEEHLTRIIDRIVSPLGRRIDESSPMVDARLPDGSRVNAIIPPLALNGPTLTIRKFSKVPLTVDDLIAFGTITPEASEFLKACVIARLNAVVSGGTGSGKTTFLNVLSGFIPHDERIITVENAAELQLRQEHVVTLESRPPNIEGKARRRGPGYAAGDEHRPRWQSDHRPCLFTPRHAVTPGNHVLDGRHGPASAGHSRPDCLGHRSNHSPAAHARWNPQDCGYHRGAGHGG